MYPHWFWRVRFQTLDSGGETLVIAPHRAAAKQAIATPPEDVTDYEIVEPNERVSHEIATQHFGGYYPRTRAVIDAGRMAIRKE